MLETLHSDGGYAALSYFLTGRKLIEFNQLVPSGGV